MTVLVSDDEYGFNVQMTGSEGLLNLSVFGRNRGLLTIDVEENGEWVAEGHVGQFAMEDLREFCTEFLRLLDERKGSANWANPSQ